MVGNDVVRHMRQGKMDLIATVCTTSGSGDGRDDDLESGLLAHYGIERLWS